MKTSPFPILNVIVFFPLASALVLALLPGSLSETASRRLGLLAGLIEIGLVVYLVADFPVGRAGFQFVSDHSWITTFGIRWRLGVDGISLFLVAVTALVFPIAMVGPLLHRGSRAFMGWMLLLEAACMGTFLSLDLFVFFILFELTLVPAYFLIAGWGSERRNYAAMKFFIYTFAGSAFFFVAMLALVLLVAPMNGGHQTFDLITLTRFAGRLPIADQVLIFCGFATAFAVKIPLVPFHSWLPDTYTEASTGGSMVLAGILFKLGAYGLLRLGVFLVPRGAADMAPVLLTLAAVGITYGAMVTIMQRDLKRLVAYASIVDVAFIVLGFFAFSQQGVSGGVLEMVNHGLTTGALFFVVGMVWERTRTFRFAELGGLQKTAPILAAVFLAVVLSAVGLPGLNGFVGEFLVLAGTFVTHRWWAVVGTTAIISGAIYLLWAYQRVFHGPLPVAAAAGSGAAVAVPSAGGGSHPIGGRGDSGDLPPVAPVETETPPVRPDMTWREIVAIAPLLAGIVFLGVFPKPFFDRVNPSVDHLLTHVQQAAPQVHVPAQARPQVRYSVPSDQQVDGVNPTSTGSGGGGQ
ncbi:MAG TPA: NADH-quinone oxidoreductase subunit M [Acidimicrobiales bacterium]|nr:NADH-quinone oxidoreductase subunit M [Acidimicrobiales bacterium]